MMHPYLNELATQEGEAAGAAWIIDRDRIEHGRAVGTSSRNYNAKLNKRATVRFRMKDDDGEIYYGGRCTPETEFEPLDDFGTPNAGCTSIEFKSIKTGAWEMQ